MDHSLLLQTKHFHKFQHITTEVKKTMMKMTLILKLQVHDAGWQAFFRMTATLTKINSYSNCTELSAFIGSLA